MEKKVNITNADGEKVPVSVKYEKVETFVDKPSPYHCDDVIQFRTPHNDYIEIYEITGVLPDDFQQFRDDYEAEIIGELI